VGTKNLSEIRSPLDMEALHLYKIGDIKEVVRWIAPPKLLYEKNSKNEVFTKNNCDHDWNYSGSNYYSGGRY